MRKALIFIVISIEMCNMAFAQEHRVIRVPGPQSVEDVSQNYFYELLQTTLNQLNDQSYSLSKINANTLTQGRSLKLLTANEIDVFWMGTSKLREQQYQAIKIPLLKGLLGYRVSIINKADLKTFKSINREQLKEKLACQGEHWPDTKILKYNNFNVIPVARYEIMFDMVNKRRCDYFPRAIFEGYGELREAQMRLNELTMFDDTIIYYPFPIYFFVRKNDNELKRTLKLGLESMIDSGKFDRFMRQHPVTQHLFPLSKWKDKTFLKLTNPYLSSEVNLDDIRYWIKL